MAKISITHDKFASEIELDDSKSALAIAGRLPFSGVAQLWKQEIYFEIPVIKEHDSPTLKVNKGDVAYWAPGHAFCIFFGDSQPISEVDIIGRVLTKLDGFKEIKEGDTLYLERT